MIPFVEELDKIHVRITTNSVPPQRITLRDKLTFDVSAVVVYHIHDAFKALFEVDKVASAIDSIAASVLRDTLARHDYSEATDFATLSQELMKGLAEVTEGWGVTFLKFAITDFAPTSETSEVLIHLRRVEVQIEGNKLLIEHLTTEKEGIERLGNEALLPAFVLRGHAPVVAISNEKLKDGQKPKEVRKEVAITSED